MSRTMNIGVNHAFPAQASVKWTPSTPGSNGTLIAVVLDESGSMGGCWDQTISGFNEFLSAQVSDSKSGQAYLTLVKFDAPQIHTVVENVNVGQVQPLNRDTYRPNGGTNLMDAIGITLTRVNKVLDSVPQAERPGVMVVIITDGAENASRDYSGETIKSMVQAAEAQDWTFTFLGANVDAFSMGASFGMNAANTASYSTASMGDTFRGLSASVSNVRFAKSAGLSNDAIYGQSLYSDTDRAKMKGE